MNNMKTAEEILSELPKVSNTAFLGDEGKALYYYVLKAMEEYAKQHAIEFTKWLLDNDWSQNIDYSWRNYNEPYAADKTTEELYKQFLNGNK